jgi:RecB family exonuclease
VEEAFEARAGRAVLAGQVDRIERDAEGRAVVVDLKTGTAKPDEDELAAHPQLGTYQLAVRLLGFAHLGLREPGGAELVQVGRAAFTGSGGRERVQAQPALADAPDPAWAEDLVARVADGMAAAGFRAMVDDRSTCRTCPVRSSCPAQPDGRQVTT